LSWGVSWRNAHFAAENHVTKDDKQTEVAVLAGGCSGAVSFVHQVLAE
jgi:hypothetical protein